MQLIFFFQSVYWFNDDIMFLHHSLCIATFFNSLKGTFFFKSHIIYLIFDCRSLPPPGIRSIIHSIIDVIFGFLKKFATHFHLLRLIVVVIDLLCFILPYTSPFDIRTVQGIIHILLQYRVPNDSIPFLSAFRIVRESVLYSSTIRAFVFISNRDENTAQINMKF